MDKDKKYDLRSDTLTIPSKAMLNTIVDAPLGDDVYGEDPTIVRLQEKAAELTGKEASLFVSSGTMGNLIAIYLNCGKGNELLVQKNSHILHYELSCATAVAGAMPVAVDGERGILTPAALEEHLRPGMYDMARVKMVSVENSHNKEGGTCYTLAELQAVTEFAEKHDLATHMDGARLFNASAGSGVPVKDICSTVDTVTFCLSKGLGAPAGSMLCGPKDFIAEAKRIRKMLGGGMRQVGVLGAAGLYALENNIEGLKQDHKNAKALAEALSAVSWADIDTSSVETNIVYFLTGDIEAAKIAAALEEKGVFCFATASNRIRFVTHLGITADDISEICRIIRSLEL